MPKSFSNSSKTSSNASLVAACAVAFALGACGGSGGSNGGGTTPPPGGGTGAQEVCSGTSVEAPRTIVRRFPARNRFVRRHQAISRAARRSASTAIRAAACSTRCGSISHGRGGFAARLASPPAPMRSTLARSPSFKMKAT